MQFDASKIGAVRRYLEGELPNTTVRDSYNFEREAQDFAVGHGASARLVTVSGEFLRVHRADGIENVLRRWHLGEAIENAGDARVIVTSKGLEIETL